MKWFSIKHDKVPTKIPEKYRGDYGVVTVEHDIIVTDGDLVWPVKFVISKWDCRSPEIRRWNSCWITKGNGIRARATHWLFFSELHSRMIPMEDSRIIAWNPISEDADPYYATPRKYGGCFYIDIIILRNGKIEPFLLRCYRKKSNGRWCAHSFKSYFSLRKTTHWAYLCELPK